MSRENEERMRMLEREHTQLMEERREILAKLAAHEGVRKKIEDRMTPLLVYDANKERNALPKTEEAEALIEELRQRNIIMSDDRMELFWNGQKMEFNRREFRQLRRRMAPERQQALPSLHQLPR
jgi:hypothetical protein